MSLDNSFEEIHSQLELLDTYLKIDITFNPNIEHSKQEQGGTMDSLLTDLKSYQEQQQRTNTLIQDSQFLKCVFSEEERIDFEKYLKEEMEKEQYMREQNQKLKRQKNKKIRYIQKHQTPKTIFNFHGVDIEVVYQKYENLSASCLIMPYDSLTVEGVRNLTPNKQLGLAILQRFNEKTISQAEENEEILSFYAGKTFRHNNYKWVYLVKKNQYKYMPEYSARKLNQTIYAILEKACGYKGTESIAFSDFDWPGLNGYSKCEVFFWGLMTAIYGQLCKRRINLTKVAICCERENSYFEFTEKLREISDSYVRAGIVAV